jgi:serine/threonine protein kinase
MKVGPKKEEPPSERPQHALRRLALPQGARLASSLGRGCFGEVWAVTPSSPPVNISVPPTATPVVTQESFVRVPLAEKLEKSKELPELKSSSDSEPKSNSWATEDSADGRWVIKTSRLPHGDAHALDTFRREVHFLRILRSLGAVPLLREWRIDGPLGIQVMERFDGTVKDLGRRQANDGNLGHNSHILVYTSAQLKRIAKLARALEDLGVVHGDAKLSNMLYRANGDDIRFSDFGFSGTNDGNPFSPLIGFPRTFGCSAERDITKVEGDAVSLRLRTPYPDSVLKRVNSGQLFMYMCRFGNRVMVRSRDGSHVRITRTQLKRLFDLGEADMAALHAFYPKF